MFRCSNNRRTSSLLITAAAASVLCSACSSKIQTSGSELSQVKVESSTQNADKPTELGERFDPAAEEAITRDSLEAWHIALTHDKPGSLKGAELKAAREADEKQAMDKLKELAQRYPASSTVRFMMGQVEEHFGKREEAVKYYQEATTQNRFNSMYVFKLAESLRKAGDSQKAIEQYRTLLKYQPDFAPGQLGLARALVAADKKNEGEAKQIAQRILKDDPDNKDARSLLSDLGQATKPE